MKHFCDSNAAYDGRFECLDGLDHSILESSISFGAIKVSNVIRDSI
jgi:hypothetical protein